MKKLTTLLALALLAVTLAGCGGGSSTESPADSTLSAEEQQAQEIVEAYLRDFSKTDLNLLEEELLEIPGMEFAVCDLGNCSYQFHDGRGMDYFMPDKLNADTSSEVFQEVSRQFLEGGE